MQFAAKHFGAKHFGASHFHALVPESGGSANRQFGAHHFRAKHFAAHHFTGGIGGGAPPLPSLSGDDLIILRVRRRRLRSLRGGR